MTEDRGRAHGTRCRATRGSAKQGGFTLVEVVAGLALLALVGGLVGAGLHGPVVAFDRARRHFSEGEQIRRLHERMVADLASASCSFADDRATFRGGPDSFELTLRDATGPPKAATGSWWNRVTYRFDPAAGRFVRIPGPEAGVPAERLVGVRASSVFLAYLDGRAGVWRTWWEAAGGQGLPAAVRVQLVGLGPAHRDEEDWVLAVYGCREWVGTPQPAVQGAGM